jgi:tetratricopeptide (TPR) repeat protein
VLFVGDVHFRKGEYDKAGEWFLHATQMEPLRETAYRYWGDALLKQSSYAAAREKFIDAVICDPYNPRVWSGVNGFLRAVGKPAVFRRVTPPPLKLVKTGESSYTLQVPRDMPKDDGSLAWIGYPTIQPAWRGGKFAQEYPQEKEYRHSLKEESVALSIVAEVAMGMQAKGQKLNDGLEFLISLRQKGVLEPYILINAADQGIAKDYAEYRRAHRDLLVRYLSEVVLPAAPASAVEQNRK